MQSTEQMKQEITRIIEKAKGIKSLKGKALFVIESLACIDELNDNELKELLTKIYKYSHVSNGICSNKHKDWKEELEKEFQELINTANTTKEEE